MTFAASSKVEGRRQSKTATLKWRGTKMPTVALQVTVTDYAKWRPVFDKYRSYRAEAGFKNERVFRNVDDPNEIIIWGEATSGSKLRRALASPELKAAM